MNSRNGNSNKRGKKTGERGTSYSVRRRQATDGPRSDFREEPPGYKVPTVPSRPFTTVDLFCGAGGITDGFCRAGFVCHYANDINRWAIETFRANHPTTHADNRPVEQVDAAALRRELKLERGELDVIVGGPPCQGFSINAPERFLEDLFFVENSRRIKPPLSL